MEILHRTHNLRISPRKLRLVADKMRYQPAEQAMGMLPLIPNKGAEIIIKSLKSAIQVAVDNSLDRKSLTIQRIFCDEGPKMKRSIGHSRGRMAMIIKRGSHLSIVLHGETKAATRKRLPAKAETTAETVEPVSTNTESKE